MQPRYGLVDDERVSRWHEKRSAVQALRERLEALSMTSAQWHAKGLPTAKDTQRFNAFEILSRPPIDWAALTLALADDAPELARLPGDVTHATTIEAKYHQYLSMQAREIERFRDNENVRLAADIDYHSIGALSNEEREKLAKVRPETLGAASRISGMTHVGLLALMQHARGKLSSQ